MKRIGFEGGSSPCAVSAPFVKLQHQRDVDVPSLTTQRMVLT
jgi:hypothetical protein